ncbi:MAG: hypothetical protein WBF84_06595 [Castellaniella sp.]|uniref:hypothetical protein n=1 Tax=Castellaniella sp. TaxID=1955812 RepID=UPI003C778D18
MNADSLPLPTHELFVHIRIIVGMILGISVARLVSGATRFIQHPGREKIYPVHFAWAICVFLFIIHFWWFEFALSLIQVWTFPLYFLLIAYSIVFVMLAAMLFPDHLNEYTGFQDYFDRRRTAFYTLLLVLFAIDVIDTLIKGQKYYHHYGIAYPIRQFLLITGAAGGLAARSARYDAAYAAFTLAAQVVWVAVLFNVPD